MSGAARDTRRALSRKERRYAADWNRDVGCAGPGGRRRGCSARAAGPPARAVPYVWARQLPEPVREPGSVIGVGDLLSVHVWEQEKISGRMRVRQDGQISMQFLNDVTAAGKTPMGLAKELAKGLVPFVMNPRVTVSVEEAQPLTVSVLGEVARPGIYKLDPGSGMAHALAAAGGLGAFAHRDRIYVVRRQPEPLRVRFTYKDVTGGASAGTGFSLMPGDVVVVE